MQTEHWRADRLDTRLAQGRLAPAHVRGVAIGLAQRHADAGAASPGRVVAPEARLVALRDQLAARGLADACAPLERLLATERSRFEARATPGAIRTIHGALDLDAVFVDAHGRASFVEPVAPAAGDTACDVARLALALRRAGRSDLAEHFVAAYAEVADDFALYPLLGFHEAMAALEGAAESEPTQTSCWLAHARLPHVAARPQLVAVGGRAASGKSTIARRLCTELAAPLVSAHAMREPASDEWSLLLALARRAEPVLDAGRSVVVDASFASQASRRVAARLARERGAAFLFTECCAFEDTRQRRLDARAQSNGDAAPVTDWEPVRDLEGGIHVVVDTTRAEPRGFARVRRVLPARPSLVA